MNEFSDNDNNVSYPEHYWRGQNSETNNENLSHQERHYQTLRIELQFSDMNRQIGELTSLVKILTEKIASNGREESDINVRRTRTPSHSANRGNRRLT